MGDEDRVAHDKLAFVRPLASNDRAQALPAQPIELTTSDVPKGRAGMSYFRVSSRDHLLVPGQPVLVELSFLTGESSRKVVPLSAVIYDPLGEAWVYTNPEPLTFVRQHVSVDYLDGDRAVLTEGPAAGSTVVTVGAPLLLGTEFKIGH
jgi:hypothetical protein